MSVQDAINLFESKQRDKKSNTQKWRLSVETSVSTNKAVLRRWSAGMSDSSAQCLPENSSEGGFPGRVQSPIKPSDPFAHLVVLARAICNIRAERLKKISLHSEQLFKEQFFICLRRLPKSY